MLRTRGFGEHVFHYLTDRQTCPLAVNITMPAVAAESRRLRSIDISCPRALSSKPAARRCKSMEHTDRRTLNRYMDPKGKGKGSPYSITERRVPELIPVLGMQSAYE